MLKFSPYSFSKISLWNQCPKKFKYKYIDKIEQTEINDKSLKRGLSFHSILENYNGEESSIIDDTIFRFVKSELGQKYLISQVLDKSIRELQIGLKYEDGKFIIVDNCSYSKSLAFYGKIDYVCIIDNVLNLIDWKSGKYKDIKYQDYNQLLYYAIYFFLKEPKINKIRISFVYIEHFLENDMILSREYLDKYIQSFKESISNVEYSNFEKKPNMFCSNCPFNEYCKNDKF